LPKFYKIIKNQELLVKKKERKKKKRKGEICVPEREIQTDRIDPTGGEGGGGRKGARPFVSIHQFGRGGGEKKGHSPSLFKPHPRSRGGGEEKKERGGGASGKVTRLLNF